MTIDMLVGKIHRATITQADLNYVGSITIDAVLMKAAGIREYQKVEIVNVNNGERFSTYTICGEPNSGIICLNGAAARCACPGDKAIIMCYGSFTPDEAEQHHPKVVFVDASNNIEQITNYEQHGKLTGN